MMPQFGAFVSKGNVFAFSADVNEKRVTSIGRLIVKAKGRHLHHTRISCAIIRIFVRRGEEVVARCGWEQVGCLIFQKSLFFRCLRDVWETKSVAEDALGQEQQRDESRLLFGETTGWDMPFQTWKFPFVSTFLYFVVFLMVIWIFPFCLSRVWQCNPKERTMSLLWKNEYIRLRGFIGVHRNGKERRGKAGDRLPLNRASRSGKRANALRSLELCFPQSIRVLCGKYSNTLRKVLRRPPHGRAKGSGPACGALRST